MPTFFIISSRKVLQGVKDHIIRLALIYPSVSFTAIDLERYLSSFCFVHIHTSVLEVESALQILLQSLSFKC